MEKIKHTQEPWVAVYHDNGNTVQGGLAGYSIQAKENAYEGIAYNCCREANARLIAAAPELLAALKTLTHGDTVDRRDYEHAESVIAKAEGE